MGGNPLRQAWRPPQLTRSVCGSSSVMQRKKRYRVQASATTKAYVYCWIAAREALGIAQRQRRASFYFRMMAGAFSAFTVEAYLNHLGQKRVRDWPAFERRLGPREKLLFLGSALGLSIDTTKRPFHTLDAMLKLRNALAHGATGTLRSDREVTDPDDPSANWPEPRWKKMCELTSVTKMVGDAEAILRDLHQQAGLEPRDPLASPGFAFSRVSELNDD